ncbi:MAG: phosphate ABC transporter permease PstA [Dehalococcoidia bacterium]|nr:phosphate ABC transporter permease PstA [Dehalococcoidia bacterium]
MTAIRKLVSGPSRLFQERFAFALLAMSTLVVLAVAGYIILHIVISGSEMISWHFLSEMPRKSGLEGGIWPAILGTLFLMLGTLIFALPVGVMAAIYLTEYAPQNWLTRVINLSIANLAGVPSIVFGLFGLGIFALGLGFGTSLLAASLTLACQALAMVITSSREALIAVPKDYREASLALGVTKLQTIKEVIVPQALPGIITGMLLSLSRAAGETAPILMVGATFFQTWLPHSPMDQFSALPYHLYVTSTQVPDMPQKTMWGIALVLLLVVLFFNSAAIYIRWRVRRGRER